MLDMKKSADYSQCVKVGLEFFNSYYDHDIRDLKSIFPDDHLDSHGQPFWSGPKRAPHPITFDANDETHLNFVKACANLIAFNLSIQQVNDDAAVRDICGKV